MVKKVYVFVDDITVGVMPTPPSRRSIILNGGVHKGGIVANTPNDNIVFHNVVVSDDLDGIIEIHEKDRIITMETARISVEDNGEGQIYCKGEVIYKKVKNNPMYKEYIKIEDNGRIEGGLEFRK